MVPTFFVVLQTSQIPRSPNGKVDRRALPPPDELHPVTIRSGPRDELERHLHSLFARALGVDEVDVDDNFFELGGDSVVLIRLLSAIRKELGREIGVATFALDPRVSSIARLMRERPSEQAAERSLVPLRRSGTRTPLFLVHAVGGSGLAYLALMSRIDSDRPLYTLQSRGLETDEAPLTTIEDMARTYLAEIKTLQPTGPYLFGGWSFGGTVAFEMANQLHDQGERASVLMIDSWAPRGPANNLTVPEETLLDWFHRDVVRVAGSRGADGQGGALTRAMRRHLSVYCANVIAMRAYVPRPCGFPLALVRAQTRLDELAEHPALRNVEIDDPRLGWGDLTNAPIDVRVAPGDHYTMFATHFVSALTSQIDQWLTAVDTRPAAVDTSHDDSETMPLQGSARGS
jgi:thioesterase domain-containing protein/acyl carrier protein